KVTHPGPDLSRGYVHQNPGLLPQALNLYALLQHIGRERHGPGNLVIFGISFVAKIRLGNRRNRVQLAQGACIEAFIKYQRRNIVRLQIVVLAIAKYTIITKEKARSEEHTSELQSRENLVCRLLL